MLIVYNYYILCIMGFIYESNLFLIIFMSLEPYCIFLASDDPSHLVLSYFHVLFCFILFACFLVNQ